MEKFIGMYEPYVYATLRIVAGLLLLCHALQKVFGLFGGVGGAAVPLGSLLGIAGLIELVTGTLITVGLFTGSAAFIASGEMAVAYFIGHFPQGFWPVANGGEPAVLNCFIFLYRATQGSGIWSLDAVRQGLTNDDVMYRRVQSRQTPG